jgi:hypothetical protein
MCVVVISCLAYLDLIGLQNVTFIQNAEITKCEHAGKVFSLSLLCEGVGAGASGDKKGKKKKKTAPVLVDCGQLKNQNDWCDALNEAAVWHETQARRAAVHLEVSG